MKIEFIYALRSIRKNKINSSINIIGLSICIACCILFYLFVNHELSHDQFHVNGNKIFRIRYLIYAKNYQPEYSYFNRYELAGKLKNEVPQIHHASAFRIGWGASIKFQEKVFDERLGIVEPDFFKMFSFPLVAGNVKSLFQNPDEVVITADLAKKIMGNKESNIESLIGKSIEFLNIKDKLFTITGILAKIPSTSSIQFDALIDFKNQGNFGQSNNDFGNSCIYVEANSEEEAAGAEANSIITIQKFYEEKIVKLKTEGLDFIKPGFQKLSDIYLDSNYSSQYEATSNMTYSFIMAGIGMLILFIACSNFILLSFGQSIKKIKEVGLRKVLGASRTGLIRQFGVEIVLLSFISVCLGIILSYFCYPFFCQLAQRKFEFSFLNNWKLMAFILLIFLFVVISCSIPLFLFSKGKPTLMMKKLSLTTGKNLISNSFITIQYILSLALIITTLFIYKQVNFMKNKSLGIDSENILKIGIPDDFEDQKTLLLKEKLKNNKEVLSITGGDQDYNEERCSLGIRNEKGEVTTVRFFRIDNDYNCLSASLLFIFYNFI